MSNKGNKNGIFPWTKMPSRSKHEENDGSTITVPDDSLSVRQMLINHSRGVTVRSALTSVYTENITAPVFYDLTDAQAHQHKLKEAHDALQAQIEAEQAKMEQTPAEPKKGPEKPPESSTEA